MKKITLLFSLFSLLAECSSISKTEAEKMVIEKYSNHLGTAKIISTEKENDDYYIQWENTENKHTKISR